MPPTPPAIAAPANPAASVPPEATAWHLCVVFESGTHKIVDGGLQRIGVVKHTPTASRIPNALVGTDALVINCPFGDPESPGTDDR